MKDLSLNNSLNAQKCHRERSTMASHEILTNEISHTSN